MADASDFVHVHPLGLVIFNLGIAVFLAVDVDLIVVFCVFEPQFVKAGAGAGAGAGVGFRFERAAGFVIGQK